MPDLGIYATEVTLAYVGSLALLFGIIGLSWAQSRRAKRLLSETESRRDG